MKKEKSLNDKTPKWFKDWHRDHYKPLRHTVGWNTRLIFVVLAVILAAAITGDADVIGRITNALGG